MKTQKRKHCSKLPDVKPVKTKLSLIRNFIMQEDDSSTIEEGFTIVRGNIFAPIDPKFTLATNNRGTELTEKEHEKDKWFVSEEDVVARIRDEMGDCAQVNGVLYLLQQYQKTLEKLEGIYSEVEELINIDILTDECDLAKSLEKYSPHPKKSRQSKN